MKYEFDQVKAALDKAAAMYENGEIKLGVKSQVDLYANIVNKIVSLSGMEMEDIVNQYVDQVAASLIAEQTTAPKRKNKNA